MTSDFRGPDRESVGGEPWRVALAISSEHERERRRQGLEAGHMVVVAAVGSADALVTAAMRTRPDVVVLGAALRGNALRAVADVCEVVPSAAVIVLGDAADEAEFLAVMAAGASGYLDAGISDAALTRAVQGVALGEAAVPRRLERRLAEAFREAGHHHVSGSRPAELTEREWEVLQLVWQGRSTREIADRLFVSPATVRTHIAAVLHKFGVRSRLELRDLIDRSGGS
jgi:DNA-binding NarL/FixJ family response regulator